MKDNFDRSLKFVLGYEGKFSDVAEDRGGPTNQGITMTTLREYHACYGYGDFDNDGNIDAEDIRLLDTPGEAEPVYKRLFWDKVRGDDLPAGIDYLIFDSAVNHGSRYAGKFLQRAINRASRNLLVVDGVIGSKTVDAAKCQNNSELTTNILRERDIFYRKIVSCDQSQEKFFKGWMNRLAKVTTNLLEFKA